MMIAFKALAGFEWLGDAWLPVAVFLAVVALWLLYLGLKAQKRPKCTGEEEMLGQSGVVRKTAGFRGRSTVEVRGEIWWCRSRHRLEKGMEVRVTGVDDMILLVEPADNYGEVV
jgi:membrane protein implicated in regulation of membrane protease activity